MSLTTALPCTPPPPWHHRPRALDSALQGAAVALALPGSPRSSPSSPYAVPAASPSACAAPEEQLDAVSDAATDGARNGAERKCSLVAEFNIALDESPPRTESAQDQAGQRRPSGGLSARQQQRRTEQLEGVADSLQQAATALRRAVGRHLEPRPSLRAGREDGTSDGTSGAAPAPPDSAPLQAGAAPPPPDVGTNTPPHARLERENAELRAELNAATQKLVELQEERQSFFDEGIYDIVNTMCRGDERAPPSRPVLAEEKAAIADCASAEGQEVVDAADAASEEVDTTGPAASSSFHIDGPEAAPDAPDQSDTRHVADVSDQGSPLQVMEQADADLEAASHDLAMLLAAASAGDGGGHGDGGPLEVVTLRLRLREVEERADALAKENSELRRNAGTAADHSTQ